MVTVSASEFDDVRAKRNAMVLAVAQALYSSGSVILAATAGLVGAQLAPSKEWATLPVSAYVIGTMPGSVGMPSIMRCFRWRRWRFWRWFGSLDRGAGPRRHVHES
jgi:hypothetical protein